MQTHKFLSFCSAAAHGMVSWSIYRRCKNARQILYFNSPLRNEIEKTMGGEGGASVRLKIFRRTFANFPSIPRPPRAIMNLFRSTLRSFARNLLAPMLIEYS